MNDKKHTVLCVDDEENILSSLKRLLRKEDYRLLTACGGKEGLALLDANEVHLVMTDQRMPGMSGVEFLSRVKEKYPDVIRIILTGYTEVDSITESINKGHIYKFFLKPWNDQNLQLEIRQALEQYDLIKTNKELHKKVVEQNEELKRVNENLEELVRERTKHLEIQNQVLELSRTILEDLPVPIIGVSADGMIVLINKRAQSVTLDGRFIEIGSQISHFFSHEVEEKIGAVIKEKSPAKLNEHERKGLKGEIEISPLSGRFSRNGVVLTLGLSG